MSGLNARAADEPNVVVAPLMERYLEGDSRAIRALYRVVAPRLREQLRRRVNDPAQIEDVVQQTFLKAHQQRDRFEWRDANRDAAVMRWYRTIARNTAIDDIRSRQREMRRTQKAARLEPTSTDRDVALRRTAPADPEGWLLGRELLASTVARVRRAVQRLPAEQREVVELHKLQGVPMREIAQRLHLRENTVRVRAHRAYRRLAADPALGSAGLVAA